MAALEVKLETEVELKCSADKYFKRLTSDDMHHFTIASPDKVHAIEIHGDDCGGIRGSVKICTYTADGKKETMKEKIEVDEATKTVSFVGIEGAMFDRYKSVKTSIQTVQKGDHAVVKITMTVEKRDAQVPDPHGYLQFVVDVAKDMDAFLLAQADN